MSFVPTDKMMFLMFSWELSGLIEISSKVPAYNLSILSAVSLMVAPLVDEFINSALSENLPTILDG